MTVDAMFSKGAAPRVVAKAAHVAEVSGLTYRPRGLAGRPEPAGSRIPGSDRSDLGEQRLSGKLAQSVRRLGAGPRQQLAVLMGRLVRLAVGDRHAELLQLFAEEPGELSGQVAQRRDLAIRSVREGGDGVAREWERVGFVLGEGQQGGGAMADRDDMTVSVERPAQDGGDIMAERHPDQRAVAAGDEHRRIVGNSMKFEFWAMPKADEAITGLHRTYLEQFEKPLKLSDVVRGLDAGGEAR